MIPSETFQATFTVPNFHQRLSAVRPIQVYTYQFDGTAAPQDHLSGGVCGTIHPFPDVQALPPHDHEHHEIALVIGGHGVHRTAGGAHELARGCVLTIAPGEVHAFERIDGLCMINCTYLTEWLFYDLRELLSVDGLASLFFPRALSSAGYRLRVPSWTLDEEALSACVRELHDIAEERARGEPSPILMRRTLEKLMLMLHRAFSASEGQPLMPLRPEICAALEHVEECILQGEPFDPAAWARRTGHSRDYFGRTFKEAMGCTPTDYYQHRRVQQASCLLLSGARGITEISQELGYFDASHFSRLFKRYRGLSPREFRHRYASD